MEVLWAFIPFTALFFLLTLIRRYVIDNWYALKIPTVSPVHPVLGHVAIFMRKNTRQLFWLYVKCFEGVNRLAKLHFGPIPVLLVNHPDVIQELMTRPELYDKPFFYEFMGLGRGLITEQSKTKGDKFGGVMELIYELFCVIGRRSNVAEEQEAVESYFQYPDTERIRSDYGCEGAEDGRQLDTAGRRQDGIRYLADHGSVHIGNGVQYDDGLQDGGAAG